MLAVKLAIVIAAAYFIYQKLTNHSSLQFTDFVEQLSNNHVITFWSILLLLFATVVNWVFEILKWRTLTRHVKLLTFQESAAQTLGGLTTSLFTPNRIGEYGAKALFFSKTERIQILSLNFIGNMGQLVVTLIFGIIGIIFFTSHFKISFHKYLAISVVIVCVVLIAALIIRSQFQKRSSLQNTSWRRFFSFFESVPWEIHLKNLGFSTIRYLVFAHQLYYILLLFDISTSYFLTMSAITSMYLISSIVPMLSIFDVVVKGSIAVWLFSFLSISEVSALSAIALMWILNFVLPSIVGSYYVMTFSFPPEKKPITS